MRECRVSVPMYGIGFFPAISLLLHYIVKKPIKFAKLLKTNI